MESGPPAYLPVSSGYLEDASGMRGRAERLFRPSTHAEAAAILAQASRLRVPVTFAGAGTGVAGGRVPDGGWIVSTELLQQLNVEPGRARVGAGVLLQDLQVTAKISGQFYAPDPTEQTASLGGTVATNASGSRSFLYGSTRDHLLSLTVAFLDGSVRTIGRGEALNIPYTPLPKPLVRKHSTGYHLPVDGGLMELLCGSDGTLCAVLEAEVALLPFPAALLSGVVFFPTEERALNAVDAWRPIPRLRMLEFMDSDSLQLLAAAYPQIPAAAGAALLIEQIGDGEMDLVEDQWLDRMSASGALDDSWFGSGAADRERFRVFRHRLAELVNERVRLQGFQKISTDLAVPLERNHEMMRWYRSVLSARFSGRSVVFGHIGDANVHVNILPRSASDAEMGRDFVLESARHAVSLGGTVSAEHGLGKRKAHLLAVEFTPDQIEAMRAVKRHFDPHWLLGRGTLFPVEL